MAPEGRKVGSLKRRVRSHPARWEMKTCTPLWREAQFEVKMYKAPHVRSTFGSWDLEKKVHAVVTWSTFPSQNVQNTPCLDRFWKLRCRKSARCWGARCWGARCWGARCWGARCWGARCWGARCWGARCCGAKHISKSVCKAHHVQSTFGRLRSYNDNCSYSYDYNYHYATLHRSNKYTWEGEHER